ncbi:MAG: hypothetical protein AAFU54_21580 [Chloroflexota bacterium]
MNNRANSVYVFEFKGTFVEIDRGVDRLSETRNGDNYFKVVSSLNEISDQLSRYIEFELERRLLRAYPSLEIVDITIEFREGSVIWEGTVTIMDWMARTADSVDFIAMIVSLISFAVNRALRSVPSNVSFIDSSYPKTEVAIISQPSATNALASPENITQVGTTQSPQWLRWALILLVLNVLISFIHLLIQLFTMLSS